MLKTFSKLIRWQIIVLLLVSVVIFVWVAYWSVIFHKGFNTAMLDLGNMSQAVWSVTQGKPLVYTEFSGPASRLLGHAEIFYAFLAPIYSIFPSPLTLVILQLLLFLGGCIPVYRLSLRRLENENMALLFGIIYLLYPVALTGVLFDIHGDTLAMPILLFALDALDRRSLWEYSIFLILALACKNYVIVPIAAIAFLLFFKKERFFAITTILTMISWVLIIYLSRLAILPQRHITIMPGVFGGDHYYSGWISSILSTWPERISHGMIAFVPVVLLSVYAVEWMLPGFIVAGGVLTSTGPGPVYKYTSHHYALIVPFLIISMIYGAEKRKKGQVRQRLFCRETTRDWKKDIIFTLGMVVIFDWILMPTPHTLNSFLYPENHSSYLIETRDVIAEAWLNEYIPEEVSLMADTFLAAHLTNRDILYRTTYLDNSGILASEDIERIFSEVDLIALDVFSMYGKYDLAVKKHALLSTEFSLQDSRDGLLLFGQSADGLYQKVTVLNDSYTNQYYARFENAIGLKAVSITKIAPRHFYLNADWVALDSLSSYQFLYAVSRLEGVVDTRIVHLPTFGLLPTTEWEQGQIIREEFELAIPNDVPPGEYPVLVSWYDSQSEERLITNDISRIGEEIEIGKILIEDHW